jgi:type II secretory pathway component GspD/PulD (secretin)
MKKITVLSALILCIIMAHPAQYVFSQEEKFITLDVKDMEIADILRMIADQSGLNIIASKNVKGAVTISLQNVPVDRALDAILKTNNAGFVKEDSIIQVYTYPELQQKEQFAQLETRVFRLKNVRATDVRQSLATLNSPRGKMEVEAKTNSIIVTDTKDNVRCIEDALLQLDQPLETRTYTLNYADPPEVAKALQGMIPVTEGEFLVDERTNSVIVTAAPLTLSKIDAMVTSWDRRMPQVLIEARIMQVTLEKNKSLGIDWQWIDPSNHNATISTKGFPIPTGSVFVDAIRMGVLADDQYEVAIRALQTNDDVDLISSPSIVTLDGTEAKILIGSSEPYEVFQFDQDGRVTGKDLKFIEVGIKLVVTPKIADDGYITLDIHPEVSSPRTGTATAALAVDTTEANTSITIKDGNTVVLGGLIKDDKETHVAKVPILGDIPLLKYAFRYTYDTTTKKEIIIFITPKIVGPEFSTSGREYLYDNRRQNEMRKLMNNIQ